MAGETSVAPGERASGQHDPRYREAITHLQVGEWQGAALCFEELAAEYPDSRRVQRGLAEAEFKARLDATTRVRARRWIIPWRAVAVRVLLVVALGALAFQGVRVISRQIVPAVAAAEEARRRAELLAEANGLLEAGDMDGAEARYLELLGEVPDHHEALEGLQHTANQRELLDLYGQAVASQEAGDYDEALKLLTEISMRTARYGDVALRITAIRDQQGLDDLFAEAEADYAAGRAVDALSKYGEIEELDVSYQRDVIAGRVFELYMALGREIIERDPPAPEEVAQALEYFSEASALEPRNAEVGLEQRLAKLFVQGQTRYDQGRWDDAIARLGPLYDERPDYLGGTVLDMLYDAYVGSGDQHQEAGDPDSAYEQYQKAAELPVQDNSLALVRLFSIVPPSAGTAIPTPAPTPTPASPGTAASTPTSTPTRMPTPGLNPLLAFRKKILFFSDNEEQPGLWVMDPTGENRQYLGTTDDYRAHYDALVEREQLSPDGRYRAFVQDAEALAQIFVALPPDEEGGGLEPIQLTRLNLPCSDPVWSPDGSRIAFASQEYGSDDIWVVYADGTGAKVLGRNTWESDRHPSWSPDSKRVAFWSDRSGVKQIYVMDADGGNVRNISNTEWNEYDPIWTG